MIDFSAVKSIALEEGKVEHIAVNGVKIWDKHDYFYRTFQRVEYLESSGTQFINTGFKPNENSKMWLDFYPTIKQSTCYAGCRNNDTYAKFTINSGSAGRKQYGGLGESGNVSLGGFSIGRHTVSIEKGVFTYDGVDTVVTAEEIETLEAKYAVYLFACNTNGATLQSTCRIYACKIWDNGTLVGDYIPCYRKSDGVAGVYNTVTQQFFRNSGTGTFAVGDNVDIKI